jgi:hypothetical protein
VLMATLQGLCQLIYDQPMSTALRESEVVFPLIETFHVLAITLIAGTIVTVDLRVGGLLFRDQPLRSITRALLPYTWIGFALMVLTGLPLFAAEAAKLYANPAFRLKMLLLAVAGFNALLFHQTAFRRMHDRDQHGSALLPARMFAGMSILLWSGIIVSGRLIAVFHGH